MSMIATQMGGDGGRTLPYMLNPNILQRQQPQAPVQNARTQVQAQPVQQPQQTPNPLQPTYMPSPPQGVATMSGAQTALTPQQLQALGPQATLQQILQGFAPQAASAQSALQNQLAAAGIVGGGAVDAQGALQGQLAQALAPTLANAIQTSQGNTLGAEEFGLQGGLQQALTNAGAANNMTGQNLQNWMQTNAMNTGYANQAGNTLAGMLQQAWGAPFGAYTGILNQGLGTAGSLAGSEANNFPVYQQNPIWGVLGQAAGAYTGGL